MKSGSFIAIFRPCTEEELSTIFRTVFDYEKKMGCKIVGCKIVGYKTKLSLQQDLELFRTWCVTKHGKDLVPKEIIILSRNSYERSFPSPLSVTPLIPTENPMTSRLRKHIKCGPGRVCVSKTSLSVLSPSLKPRLEASGSLIR